MDTIKNKILALIDNENLIPYLIELLINKPEQNQQLARLVNELNIDINQSCKNLIRNRDLVTSIKPSVLKLIDEIKTIDLKTNTESLPLIAEVFFTIWMLSGFKNHLYSKVVYILAGKDGNEINNILLRSFVRNYNIIPEKKRLELLEIISKNSNISSLNTPNIDFLISNILIDDPLKAIEILESILVQNPKSISIKELIATFCYLNKSTVSIIFTRWLSSKKSVLCHSASILIAHFNERIFPTIELSQVPIASQNAFLSLAIKTIGWIYSYPKTIIYFISSMLENTESIENEELNQIIELIFNPLLLSYPETISSILNDEIQKYESSVKKLINKQLKKLESYNENFKRTWTIKELKPYQTQRDALFRLDKLRNEKIMSEVFKSSPILGSMSKFILLYGRKAIRLSHEKNSSPQRVEIPLQHTSVSFELPRLALFDPHGLEIMLLNFKLEGCDE
ncbi:TPA: hypothetical protein ACYUR3_002101 [Legionella pneumophila]